MRGDNVVGLLVLGGIYFGHWPLVLAGAILHQHAHGVLTPSALKWYCVGIIATSLIA